MWTPYVFVFLVVLGRDLNVQTNIYNDSRQGKTNKTH
jgi:hypothetical protein